MPYLLLVEDGTQVKFFLYLHFDILDKNDGDEKLTDKFYDIFVSYRYITFVKVNG